MSKKRKNYGNCTYCGEPEADTKDHIPPKQLLRKPLEGFPKPVLVPAHQKCNATFKQDDELLAALILFDRDTPIVAEEPMERLMRAIRDNEFQGLKRILRSSMRSTGIVDPQGNPVETFLISGGRINRSLTRIVRALSRSELGIEYLDPGRISVKQDESIYDLLDESRQAMGRVTASNQFRYFTQAIEHSEFERVWILVFYERFQFNLLVQKLKHATVP